MLQYRVLDILKSIENNIKFVKRTNGSSFICNIDYTAINNILLINNQFISSIENGFSLESEPIIYNSCLESQIDIDVDNLVLHEYSNINEYS